MYFLFIEENLTSLFNVPQLAGIIYHFVCHKMAFLISTCFTSAQRAFNKPLSKQTTQAWFILVYSFFFFFVCFRKQNSDWWSTFPIYSHSREIWSRSFKTSVCWLVAPLLNSSTVRKQVLKLTVYTSGSQLYDSLTQEIQSSTHFLIMLEMSCQLLATNSLKTAKEWVVLTWMETMMEYC